MANLTEEKCQKSGKKYGVVCCSCRSTFVASLLKNPLARIRRFCILPKNMQIDKFCFAISKFIMPQEH